MVRWYPGDLLELLEKRYPPSRVHTILILTKFPDPVLSAPLAPVLRSYDQVVVQLTVTGLGGSFLEPAVPGPEKVMARLPELVRFTGSADRVALRVDPILHWRDPRGRAAGAPLKTPWGGLLRSNEPLFARLAASAADRGIRLLKTSLVTPYPKVLRRFARAGVELVVPNSATRGEILDSLESDALLAGVNLEFCGEPRRPGAACVDAALLARLHPRGLAPRSDRASGQRPACGCAHAVDLGWYSAHPCHSACLYCYANPSGPR